MWLLAAGTFFLFLLPSCFFICKIYRHLFLDKGSHPFYIAPYQVFLQLQQGICSGKYSIFRSCSHRSERKSGNTSKYFLWKADRLPQSMALRPIIVTDAFFTTLGTSSACLAPRTYSSHSEIMSLTALPNLIVGAGHKISIFYIALRKM